MKPKFDLAPQEQLIFVRKLLPIFLDKILGHPEALVTDLTKITHFTNRDIEDSIGKGSKPGHYLFKLKIWRRKNKDGTINLHKPQSDDDYKEEIWERKAIHERKWIIRKYKRIFGVDITDCYEKEIPIVLKHIMVNVSREKAIKLELLENKNDYRM
ncbi:MAG: hypothetical protein KBF93_12785 [Leptospiraceae bacterium]|nr:hypothetical protein [Leptospiraceae bacterium]